MDLEGNYSCYEMKKIHIWQAREILQGRGHWGDTGEALGRGRGAGTKVDLHCPDPSPVLRFPRSQHPIDFPAGCEVRQEAGTCQFSLVQKSDPRLPCKGGGPDPEWGSANTPAPAAPAPHSS